MGYSRKGMSRIDTVYIKDSKGDEYRFNVYLRGTKFKNVSAVYFFVKKENNQCDILYIGQSEHLGDRISGHNKLPELEKAGYTHIFTRQFCKDMLLNIEKSFIKKYAPPYNDHNNPEC